MFKTFTQDDSLRYIYNEMKNEEKLLFESKLISDFSFFQEFLNLQETISILDSTLLLEPSTYSTLVIKSMNSSFQICETQFGKFDLFLN